MLIRLAGRIAVWQVASQALATVTRRAASGSIVKLANAYPTPGDRAGR